MLLISACLAGVNCKYDGGNNLKPEIIELLKKGEAVLVCPEQLGGLPTPRLASEIKYIAGKRRVEMKDGTDVTKQYERGAEETVALAQRIGATKAILQSRSPSCGCGIIYDGTFTKTRIKGNGITAQLLLEHGVDVVSSDEYLESIKN